jgi:hypothetical protein
VYGGRGIAQLQSGENNTTFDYLGETRNELKLTDFQKNSGDPKISILAPRLTLQAVWTHIPNLPGTTSKNMPTKTS